MVEPSRVINTRFAVEMVFVLRLAFSVHPENDYEEHYHNHYECGNNYFLSFKLKQGLTDCFVSWFGSC
jgi:hypothetical protein